MDISYHFSVFYRGLRHLGNGILFIALHAIFPLVMLIFLASLFFTMNWIGGFFGLYPPEEVIPYSGFGIPVLLSYFVAVVYELGLE